MKKKRYIELTDSENQKKMFVFVDAISYITTSAGPYNMVKLKGDGTYYLVEESIDEILNAIDTVIASE